jgi:hypothetical protein
MRRFGFIAGIFLLGFFLTGCGWASAPAAVAVQAKASAAQSEPDFATLSTRSPSPIGGSFIIQPGFPDYLPAFTRPEAGCAWVGIAGQVLDQFNQPLPGIRIHVVGSFNGLMIDSTVTSGDHTAYGPAGFEIQVGTQSIESQNNLTIQLLDDSGHPLSPPFHLTTYADCQKNLILIQFQASPNS